MKTFKALFVAAFAWCLFVFLPSQAMQKTSAFSVGNNQPGSISVPRSTNDVAVAHYPADADDDPFNAVYMPEDDSDQVAECAAPDEGVTNLPDSLTAAKAPTSLGIQTPRIIESPRAFRSVIDFTESYHGTVPAKLDLPPDNIPESNRLPTVQTAAIAFIAGDFRRRMLFDLLL